MTSLQFFKKMRQGVFHPLQKCVDYIITEYPSLIFIEEKTNLTFL